MFGDKFALRMSLSEALSDDLVAIQAGVYSLLPHDLSGRRILYIAQWRHTRKGYDTDSLVSLLTCYRSMSLSNMPSYSNNEPYHRCASFGITWRFWPKRAARQETVLTALSLTSTQRSLTLIRRLTIEPRTFITVAGR